MNPVSIITFIGSNPTFAPDGSLLSAPVQAMFNTTVEVDGQSFSKTENVSWDGTRTDFTVTVDGVELTPKQVTSAAAAIANLMKNNPPPLPIPPA